MLRQRIQIGNDVGALGILGNAGEAHCGTRNEALRIGDELVEIVERPGAALGLHGGREVEAVAALTPCLTDDAIEVRTDTVRAALLEGVASAALLGSGGTLLDRGGLEQLFDRLGSRGGSAAFLAVAGVFLHGDLKARLLRHLRREQRTRGEARHQQKEAGTEHGTENLVQFERVHFRPGPTPQEGSSGPKRPPGRASENQRSFIVSPSFAIEISVCPGSGNPYKRAGFTPVPTPFLGAENAPFPGP